MEDTKEESGHLNCSSLVHILVLLHIKSFQKIMQTLNFRGFFFFSLTNLENTTHLVEVL